MEITYSCGTNIWMYIWMYNVGVLSRFPSEKSQARTHKVHKQLLAGLSDAPEGHINILLAWQAIHTIIQGVWHSFGYLEHNTASVNALRILTMYNITKPKSKAILGKKKNLKCKFSSQFCH